MVERFFPTKQNDLSDKNESDKMMLLSGPPSCGKTSLLFQFAFNQASQRACANVIFICNKQRLETKPPFLPQGIDSTSDVFQGIQMKYIKDDEGLKKYFAAFHLHKNFPLAVLVDNFGAFFSESHCQARYGNVRGRDIAMVRTLALCRDAINHANERLESGGSCKLLLSDTHLGDIPRLLFIYKRWIQCIFTVKGNGLGSYLLENSSIAGSGLKRRVAKYSIALQYLVLEELIEE